MKTQTWGVPNHASQRTLTVSLTENKHVSSGTGNNKDNKQVIRPIQDLQPWAGEMAQWINQGVYLQFKDQSLISGTQYVDGENWFSTAVP